MTDLRHAPYRQEPAVPHASIVTGGPTVTLPTRFGVFEMQAWTDSRHDVDHLSLSAKAPAGSPSIASLEAPLVRVHSECLTGDVFASYRCDCGEQLEYALEQISLHGGTVIYLRGQEGRGIGLANKVQAYSLQDAGADTLDANLALGLPVDSRDYTAAADVLRTLGLSTVRLLSNNPQKREALESNGIDVVEMVAAKIPARPENQRYLQSKRDRLHHTLGNLELNPGTNTSAENGTLA